VVDLDRDMSDVVPTGTTRDSEYLFARMTGRTLDLARPGRAGLRPATELGSQLVRRAAVSR
jgi:hypothetical protein